jgi:hypothetical protein
VKVIGSSADGFAALAGISTDRTKVQTLLNNYQFDFDIATEITAQIVSLFINRGLYELFFAFAKSCCRLQVPILNTSTSAYPLLQDNGRK